MIDPTGSIYAHTKKAINKANAPADRLFTVCGIQNDQGTDYYLAWKCIKVGDLIKHPGYEDLMNHNDPRLFSRATTLSGSQPTALFIPDSFYTKIN